MFKDRTTSDVIGQFYGWLFFAYDPHLVSNFSQKTCIKTPQMSVHDKMVNSNLISEPEFYGGLVYRIRQIVMKSNFSEQCQIQTSLLNYRS